MTDRKWSQLFIAFLIFLNSISLLAQPGGGGAPMGPLADPPPPNPVPIGGLEILLGAGALLGVRKIMKQMKDNSKEG